MTSNKESYRKDYISRINRVINYITEHPEKKLTLKELAKIACFSSYHFHRIFSSLTGETLHNFILRTRLEKAANVLCFNENLSITKIAYDYGFSSPSHFSTSFKDYFELTPSEFREKFKDSKIMKANSKISKVSSASLLYSSSVREEKINFVERSDVEMELEIKETPERLVAYVRHIGKYEDCGVAWEKLCQWAGPRGLLKDSTVMIGVSYDNPEITPEEKCRYDACITVPEDTKVSGEVGLQTVAAGRYAVYEFDGCIDDIGEAYYRIYAEWLPESGFQVDDRPCYDVYHNDPDDNPQHRCQASIHIPVKPL